MNEITTALVNKSTMDFAVFVGVIVAAVVVLLIVAMVFIKVTRLEKIGIGGIECDPEDEKSARKKTVRKTAVKK